jgi:hypothetical protein
MQLSSQPRFEGLETGPRRTALAAAVLSVSVMAGLASLRDAHDFPREAGGVADAAFTF